MTEFKNTEQDLHRFRVRLSVLGGLVFFCFALLLARFIWLQVIKHSDYIAKAEDNRIAVVPIVPNRGLILDLFEKLISGDVAAALGGLAQLHNCGADPLAVMQDLLETTHFLTRVKVAPAA